jgi:hypothetical protein
MARTRPVSLFRASTDEDVTPLPATEIVVPKRVKHLISEMFKQATYRQLRFFSAEIRVAKQNFNGGAEDPFFKHVKPPIV